MTKWLLDHQSRLIGWLFAVVAGAHLFKHEWLQAIVILPLAGILWVQKRSVDAAFQSGWHAGAAAMDDQLFEHLDLERRARARFVATRHIPTQNEYHTRLQAMVAELELMEDPSAEEVVEVYRRYRGGE